jgi:protein TonB
VRLALLLSSSLWRPSVLASAAAHGAVAAVAAAGAVSVAPPASPLPSPAVWEVRAEEPVHPPVADPGPSPANGEPSPTVEAPLGLPPEADVVVEDDPVLEAPEPVSVPVDAGPAAPAARLRAASRRPSSPPSVAARASAAAPAGPTHRRVSPPTPRATNLEPAYPAEALANRWQGVTTLRLTIDAEGRVARVVLERSSGHAVLDAAAAAAVREWTFFPASVDGVPTAVTVLKPVVFTL